MADKKKRKGEKTITFELDIPKRLYVPQPGRATKGYIPVFKSVEELHEYFPDCDCLELDIKGDKANVTLNMIVVNL